MSSSSCFPRPGCAWLCALAFACSGVALAQTNPLAAISGRVEDLLGAPLAGVSVTASSPALQGVREGTSNATGDYLIPFLPAGDYEIVFRREGFVEARAVRSLRSAETSRVDVGLEIVAVSESITVMAEPESVVGQSTATSTTYPAQLIDKLPVDRDYRGATLLAPGVSSLPGSGPVIIAGALAYENLFLVDGVSVKDRLGGQPRPFAIEDAIEEVSTAVTGISPQFGRFAGGVVNVVTRSGGNELKGSFRVTLNSEAWSSLTPWERENLEEDPRTDDLVPTYEATLGGPLRRDRLWYFLALRREEATSSETTAYTGLPFQARSQEKRWQTKLTWSPRPEQSLRLSYSEIDTHEENGAARVVMDLASLGSSDQPEELLSLHYTATVGDDLFFEAQVSDRRGAVVGAGARTTDLLSGTVLIDRSREGAQWNSPQFCGVCGVPPGELKRIAEADRGYAAKASRLFSHPRFGAHHVMVGGELFDETRKNNSFQSGSGFLVTASEALLEDEAIYPVFLPDGSTVIEWRPIHELSEGSRFRTVTGFVNDDWRWNDRWSFNLGLRWDQDRSRDQSGHMVSDTDTWSPRLAAAFDPRGDGVWTIDAGWARYQASLNFSIGDLGTSQGRPARYAYTYLGPEVNADPESGTPLSSHEALALLFDWFFANGGTSRPLRGAPFVPGLNRIVDPGLVLPSSDEVTLGVTRTLAGRGFLRLAGVRREFHDRESSRIDTGTGQVTDPASGSLYDLELIGNSGRIDRTYQALLAQVDLRFSPRLRLAGSYTLSKTSGNDGEPDAFPEYGEERWRSPTGPLETDQRHRLRLWASWDAPLGERWGKLSIAVLENLDSGLPSNTVGFIDTRSYVENPGYLNPPGDVPYYFEPRGSHRAETATATGLAIHYTLPVAFARRAELFARLVVVNLFDESAQTGAGDTYTLTAADDDGLVPFDPFREQPVRGVHWDYGPDWGRPFDADAYQEPRSFTVSFGVRF